MFQHERLKLAIIRTGQGNVYNIPQLMQVLNVGIRLSA